MVVGKEAGVTHGRERGCSVFGMQHGNRVFVCAWKWPCFVSFYHIRRVTLSELSTLCSCLIGE